MANIDQNHLAEQIKEFGFSTDFSIPTGTNDSLIVYYKNIPIVSPFYKGSLVKTTNALERKLMNVDVEQNAAQLFITYFTQVCIKTKESEHSSSMNENQNIDGKKKNEYVYKYSKLLDKNDKKKKKSLYESVMLTTSNDGESTQPVFLYYDKEQDKIKAVRYIEESNMILNPVEQDEYQYMPYTYDTDIDEANLIKDQIKNTTIESFYKEVLELVMLFNIQDKDKQVLIAANIIWSYFQDKFPTCHYPTITGKPGSGKTSVGHTFGALGYRPIYQVDPSAPNIFRTLGKIEAGQCTLILDEADRLAMSSDLMATIKTGYDKKGKTPRINQFTNKPEYFHSYCLKFIIAERIPKEWKTDGILHRMLSWVSQPGISGFDIKEVLNEESRNPEQQQIFDRIIPFRKKMVIYRLVHFNDPVANIDVGVVMRDKELVKPMLQLFYNHCSENTLNELIQSLQNSIDEKNEVKKNSIDEVLYSIVVNLVAEYNTYEIPVEILWKALIETLEGPHSYRPTKENRQNIENEFSDYGKQYKTTISRNIVTMFSAEHRHRNSGNVILFSKQKIDNLTKMRHERRIEVKEIFPNTDNYNNRGEGSEGNEGSREGPCTAIEVYRGIDNSKLELSSNSPLKTLPILLSLTNITK
jgi:hypothetical protein